jgi:hypothetical protein
MYLKSRTNIYFYQTKVELKQRASMHIIIAVLEHNFMRMYAAIGQILYESRE